MPSAVLKIAYAVKLVKKGIILNFHNGKMYMKYMEGMVNIETHDKENCMTRILLFLFIALTFYACSSDSALQDRVNKLETKLSETYKPGFGEFMGYIQIHHAKLWFAGKNENWDLADFEIKEIKETFGNLQKYETDRPEIQTIPMIFPALDSISTAISGKNAEGFNKSFRLLTKTCNLCHQAVGYGFNRVKIPEEPPFSNQIFTKTGKP